MHLLVFRSDYAAYNTPGAACSGRLFDGVMDPDSSGDEDGAGGGGEQEEWEDEDERWGWGEAEWQELHQQIFMDGLG